MGKRRKSRELALQALFYMDMSGDDSEERLALFLRSRTPSKKALPFFLELVRGVVSVKPQIDALIERFSSNWKISRMSCVDRNILRISIYEMFCREDIPVKVSINEAIDIGKKFGTEDSGAFINGILDSIRIAAEKEKIQIEIPASVSKPTATRSCAPDAAEIPPPSTPAATFHPVKGKRGVVKRERAFDVRHS